MGANGAACHRRSQWRWPMRNTPVVAEIQVIRIEEEWKS